MKLIAETSKMQWKSFIYYSRWCKPPRKCFRQTLPIDRLTRFGRGPCLWEIKIPEALFSRCYRFKFSDRKNRYEHYVLVNLRWGLRQFVQILCRSCHLRYLCLTTLWQTQLSNANNKNKIWMQIKSLELYIQARSYLYAKYTVAHTLSS